MNVTPTRRQALAALLALPALPSAWARLDTGAVAPPFELDAALGGQAQRFQLAQALAQGPVVLYFYPKAFTSGCTIEAKEFADATPKFEALGARVVGVSADTLEVLQRFSVEACRNRFAVAADPQGRVIAAYRAQISASSPMANRISYVIDRNGRIAWALTSADPSAHVSGSLQAVQQLAAARR